VGSVGLVAVGAVEAVVGLECSRLEQLVKVDEVLALQVLAELPANGQLDGSSADWVNHIQDYLLSACALLLLPTLNEVVLSLQLLVIDRQPGPVLDADHGHDVEDE
jgi:hypothetical protein